MLPYGGALFMTSSVVMMTDVTMTNNTSNWGGAIYQNSGELAIPSGELSNNTSKWGGAIYQAKGNLSLNDVVLSGNESVWGGGLYQAGGAAVLTENTKFDGNTANRNFGKVLVKSKNAELAIQNSETDEILRPFDTALSLYLDEVDWEVDGM